MKSPILCASIVLALCFAATSFAGQAISDGKSGKKIIQEPIAPEAAWLVNVRASHTFESDFSRGQKHGASGDSAMEQIDISHRFSLAGAGLPTLTADGAWYFRVGAAYTRWDFDNSGGLPLPNHLQSANAKIALEYLVKGHTGFLLETEPGIYFEDDIHSDNFDAPTKLALAYPVSDRFLIVGGVSYSALRTYQFFPIVGFIWTINDHWTINALPPEPRIIYTASDKLSIWAGGELAGGSFRTDSRDLREKKSLNNAVLTYSEWRAGVGLTYRVCNACEIELGGGYAFQRKFDFHRAEEGFETDEGAPYLKVQLSGAF